MAINLKEKKEINIAYLITKWYELSFLNYSFFLIVSIFFIHISIWIRYESNVSYWSITLGGPYNVPLKSMTWTNGLFLVTFLANAPNQSFGVLESNKMLYIVWFSRKKFTKHVMEPTCSLSGDWTIWEDNFEISCTLFISWKSAWDIWQ